MRRTHSHGHSEARTSEMSSMSDYSDHEIGRRRFIQGAAVLGAGLAADYLSFGGDADAGVRLHRWSSPRTWGGRVPGRGDVVRITKDVLLDVNARVRGIVIEPGASLVFHPRRSITLRSRGNVIVNGRLEMVPASPAKRHRLVFVDVEERRFKGGGMKPLASDVGLWVMRGVLRVRGSDKLAWTRAAGSIPAGAREIELQAEPGGWGVGDEIVITPTLAPPDPKHSQAFDRATVAGINGRRITISRATNFVHPQVQVAPGKAMAAEVLNLTRNVVIEGAPRHRAHIKISAHRRQKISNLEVRYMGPRKRDGKFTKKIAGRWPFHFHHAGHGSHGSVVRGVVVRDSGSHAFVAHKSHGILFKDCIAFKNLETPYWWDEPTRKDRSLTKGTTYDSCVAALINFDPPHRGGTALMGFKMAQGTKNRAVNCVAVGVLGQVWGDSSGFGWVANQWGVWGFKDCVSHNNLSLGNRFWINDPAPNVLDGFVVYHNGRFGSFDGAYTNAVRYIDCAHYRNGDKGAIHGKATSGKGVPSSRPKAFIGLHVDQAGASNYCVEFAGHVNDPEGARTVLKGCDFRGYKKAALGFTNNVRPSANVPDLVDVIDCSFSGNEFWLGDNIHPRSRIRVQDPQHGAIQLARWDQVLEGIFKPEWNAWVKNIDPFD